MDILNAILLAILQGVVEFLPISSSGHLILIPALLGWSDQGLGFDIAVHLGTLIAVVAYFRGQLTRMARDWIGAVAGGGSTQDSRLAWMVLVGTIPLGLAGLLTADLIERHLREPWLIGLTTGGFGILLWLADRFSSRATDEHAMSWNAALLIGLGQALALIPGTSRSGITMTVGLALGLTRDAAARFSFLLSVPAIAMAGSWLTLQAATQSMVVDWSALAIGTTVSAVTAYLTIGWFMRFVSRSGMLVFALYRLALTGVIFYVLV